MKVASVTVMAIIQGFRLGFQTAVGAEREVGRASAAAALIPVRLLEASPAHIDAQKTPLIKYRSILSSA
jgi:hypothetical protein